MSATCPAWKMWLAYHIGRIELTAHGLTSGRDAMREIRARFDQMGAPESEWAEIEKAALQRDSAIALRVDVVRIRVMNHLAGFQPIGPIERISG